MHEFLEEKETVQTKSKAVQPDTAVIQRMAVWEGDGHFNRYKRVGWFVLRNLKRYFKPKTLSGVTGKNLETLVQELDQLVKEDPKKINGDALRQKFLDALPEGLDVTTELDKFWRSNPSSLDVQKNIELVKADIEEAIQIMREAAPGEFEQKLLAGIEYLGKYKRAEKIDPYFNYKKYAIHCIAHMATKKQIQGITGDAGPHIAITVLGKRIYAATNTRFRPYQKKSPLNAKELCEKLHNVLNSITEQDVNEIMIGDKKSEIFVSGAMFEDQEMQLTKIELEKTLQWIQIIKEYPIVIVDVPEHRKEPDKKKPDGGRKSIHGEMTITDYLIKEAEAPLVKSPDGVPQTTREILSARKEKLMQIDPGQQGDAKLRRRLIQMGGTRIDCCKCHEHFDELRSAIEGFYIVSSQEKGEIFSGTEEGTRPKDQKLEGKAKVVRSFPDPLKEIGCRLEQIELSVKESWEAGRYYKISDEEIVFLFFLRTQMQEYMSAIIEASRLIGEKDDLEMENTWRGILGKSMRLIQYWRSTE